MNYTDRDPNGIYKNSTHGGPGPMLMGANTLDGNDVYNRQDEDLGNIKEIMLDMTQGRIAYAVLAYGGFMGLGEKLFAVPWRALTLDTVNKRFVLDIAKDRLELAPGFDKGHWPDMADKTWAKEIDDYYGIKSESEMHN